MRNVNYYNDDVSKSFKAETPKATGAAKEDLAFTEWKETFNTSADLTAASFNLGINTKFGNKFLTDASFDDNMVTVETSAKVLDNEDTPKKDESKDAKKMKYDLTVPAQLDAFVRLLPGVSTAKERSEAKALITAKINGSTVF